MIKSRHRIIFIGNHFGEPRSGGEKYNFLLVNILKKRQYWVAVITDTDIPVIMKGNIVLYNIWYIVKLFNFRDSIILIDSRLHSRVFLFLMFVKMFTNNRILGTVHHLTWGQRKTVLFRAADRIIEKIFISCCDSIIVPSFYTLKSIKEISKTGKSVNIISPPISAGMNDHKLPEIKNNKKVEILFVGTVQKRKGIIYLVESLNYLRNKDYHLNIAGDLTFDTDYVKMLNKYIKENQLSEFVSFLGPLSEKELHKQYLKADFFVLPSLHEGYGMSVVEAMKYGLPVIVTNVSALPYIVKDKINGMLVPPENSGAIAKAIDFMIENPGERQRMSINAAKFSGNANSEENVEEEFIKILESIK